MNDKHVSRELVVTDAGRFFVIEGSPVDGYDLFLCRVEAVGHYKRKWQARDEAYGRGDR